jgi:hypothetical protein
MTKRQGIFRLLSIFGLLVAGYITQSSVWKNYCIHDLTCWYRNMPGLLKLVDARNVLENSYKMSDLINKVDQLYWSSDIPQLRAEFSIKQFTVADMIELLGEPAQVDVVQAFSPGTNCAGLFIMYTDKGVIAYLYPEGDSVGISPSQSISRLVLIAPEVLQGWNSTDITLHDWQGFIDYCNLHNLTLPQPLRK